MTDMLKEAIVDAEALRNAAMKNAQTVVLEKYAGTIKEAVEKILEADITDLPDPGDDEEEGMPPGSPEPPVPLGANASLAGGTTGGEDLDKSSATPAAFDGERLCQCPDDEEVVELDFADLQAEIGKTAEPGPGSSEEHEEAAEDIMGLKEDIWPIDDTGSPLSADRSSAALAANSDFENEQGLTDIPRNIIAYLKAQISKGASAEKIAQIAQSMGYARAALDKVIPLMEECPCKKENAMEPAGIPASDVAVQGEELELTEEDLGALLEMFGDEELNEPSVPGDEEDLNGSIPISDKGPAFGSEPDEFSTTSTIAEGEKESDPAPSPVKEEMVVDHKPVPTGKSAFHAGTTGEQIDEAENNLIAMQADSFKEELDELKKATKKLQEEKKSFEQKSKRLYEALQETSSKLSESNVRNARLLYANKTLANPSLNERQKQKLVEAVLRVGSVEEAKTVYETLSEALHVVPEEQKQRATLTEALNRNHTTIMHSRQEEKAPEQDPFWNAQIRLAGIEGNKNSK